LGFCHGWVALAALTYIAVVNTLGVTNSLSNRLETSVSLLAEEQLTNTVFTEANLANQSFADIADDVTGLATYWSSLRDHGTHSVGEPTGMRVNLVQLVRVITEIPGRCFLRVCACAAGD
jgi:hypothetical protein